MNTPSYPIEIKFISGEGLRYNRRKLIEKNVFVIIRTDSVNAQSTNIDSGEKLMVDIPTNLHFVKVEVFYKGRFGDKLVGAARIPVTDFVGGFIPVNHLHLLSYRLRDGRGERNGIINLSVKVKVAPPPPPPRPSENGGFAWRPSSGKIVTGEVNGGVVTGVPIWYGYRSVQI